MGPRVRDEAALALERMDCCEVWERRAGFVALEVVGRSGASVKGSCGWRAGGMAGSSGSDGFLVGQCEDEAVKRKK